VVSFGGKSAPQFGNNEDIFIWSSPSFLPWCGANCVAHDPRLACSI
jgi:hypothetical protein